MHALATCERIRYCHGEPLKDMSADQAEFGTLLRSYRTLAGLTQEELAARAGLSLRGISDLERGLRRVPYPDTVDRLAEALRLDATQRDSLKLARHARRTVKEEDGSALPGAVLVGVSTSFVGRERELDEVRRLLATAALVTVTGGGGMGKSRLAMETAQQLTATFADGVQFVPLAGVGTPDLLISAIATSLGVSLHAAAEPMRQLANHMREKQLLLVLDNFEHLLEAAGLLPGILSTAPGVKILVTSRERLNLQEEWVLPIDGLSYPSGPNATGLDAYPAVRLFQQRARQVYADFSLDHNAESVIALCQRVDGMPLALEIAATWLRMMPCDQIVFHLDRSLDFLSARIRNVPDRHRSIRAVFDHSWKLLSDIERRVLIQLSVFRGGFDLQSAERVAGASVDVIARLVDKSMIRVTGSARYDLHELVRQYLSEKLAASSDVAIHDVNRRHFQFFATLAEEADQHTYGRDQEVWYDRLEVESNNLAAALSWSLDADASAGLHMAASLGFFWHLRGHEHDGLDWLEALLNKQTGAPALVRAKALGFAGAFIGSAEYDRERARSYCELSLALAREVGDKSAAAWSLSTMGFFVESNLDRAIEHLHRALSFFRELDSGWGISQTLRRLGLWLTIRRQYHEAGLLLEESLARAREAEDPNAIAWSLLLLARLVWEESKDQVRATAMYEESLSLSRVIHSNFQLGDVLSGLAEIAEACSDYATARAHYDHAVELWQELRVGWRRVDWAWHGLPPFSAGRVAQAQGDYELARRRYEGILLLGDEKGTDHPGWLVAHGLWGLAKLATLHGDAHRAAILLGAAEQQVKALPDIPGALMSRYAFDSDVALAKAELTDTQFADAFATGLEMSTDAIVAYGLGMGASPGNR